MRTKAVRLYGKDDLRLEEFDLPDIGDGEILARVVSDSLCMSSYKAVKTGSEHKRVPDDIGKNPVIIGHEFCGELIKVGKKWSKKFREGQKFVIQPALNYLGSLDAPGYSFRYIGGCATYVVIPSEVMETDCLLPYEGDAYFYGSLAEPMSCIIGAYHANYHTTAGSYEHKMGIKEGGNTIILAGAGPMGLGAVDYAVNCNRRPKLLVVTDTDSVKIKRAAEILPPETAAKKGVKLVYADSAKAGDEKYLTGLTGGKGYDDVFVYAPVRSVVELGDRLLGLDGCLNFFAGPTDQNFKAEFNFFNAHYASTHIVGTSGGNTDDMRESLGMMSSGLINPSAMVTHIGGLDAAAETTLKLSQIPGGKKLIYTHISMPLTAIADFEALGKTNPLFATLAEITKRHNGLWSAEAERYLLKTAGE